MNDVMHKLNKTNAKFCLPMTPAKCHYRIVQNRAAGILNTIIIVSVSLLLTGSLII